MAWEQRGRHRYYYRAQRIAGRVVKTYVGRGLVGELAAHADALARLRRLEHLDDVAAAQTEEAQLDELDRQVAELLNREGFHQPKRGRWRRKRAFRANE